MPYDSREKFIGVYHGTLFNSYGCTMVDTIPVYDTLYNANITVQKYKNSGISCRSSFFNYDFDTLNINADSSIEYGYREGGRYVLFFSIQIIKDTLFFYYMDGITNKYDTKCPIVPTKSLIAIKWKK